MTENVLICGNSKLYWDSNTIIMGVLNVTPDSFSDGGKYLQPENALEQAQCLVRQGAHIIDIGGESTRPFSEPVPADQELERVLPVIRAIRAFLPCPISIDTTKADVAEAALEAGADMVNDISGLRMDGRMADLVRERDVPVVIMHMKGTPSDMQRSPFYEDVLGEIDEFFQERISYCLEKGISRKNIILDPGIGFGKRFQDNLDIINGIERFARHGLPVMVGPSRKAFLGEITGRQKAGDRDSATVGAAVACALNGAAILRVHNVEAVADALKVADALNQRRKTEVLSL
jgi:dihydropteroate synthase